MKSKNERSLHCIFQNLVAAVDNWWPPIINFHFLCLSPQICARTPFNRFNGFTRFNGFLVSVLAKTSIVSTLVSLVSKSGQSGNSIAVAEDHQALSGPGL